MNISELPIMRFAFSDRAERTKRIVVLNGHPDPRPERFCSAICDAYLRGAKEFNFDARYLAVAELGPPLSGFVPARNESGLSDAMIFAANEIRWANWLVIAFPLWLNGPPPSLQAIFHAYSQHLKRIGTPSGTLTPSKDAHVIVTMSMPALLFGGRERSSRNPLNLSLSGVEPRRTTLIGGVETLPRGRRAEWLSDINKLGGRGM
jgi:putative NADPH-quinone reductase